MKPFIFACALGFAAVIVDGRMSARQITLRSSGGPATSALAERLAQYQPDISEVPPLSRDALWSGAGDFRREATTWINAGGPDIARRRLVVATYVLDLLKVEQLWSDRQGAPKLVEWACTMLRQSPVRQEERPWWTASIAIFERSGGPLQGHLEHAESRFPDDDHWTLVRTVIDEFESERGRREDGTLSIAAGLAARTIEHFQQAAARDSVRQEALIRWGAFESDLGRHDAALAHFDQAGEPEEGVLRFWLHLVKGRTLERAGRLADAIESYRRAVAAEPPSQSAALALAAALVDAHRMTEASAAVLQAVQPEKTPAGPDLWVLYRTPDVRRWPGAMIELRGAVAP